MEITTENSQASNSKTNSDSELQWIKDFEKSKGRPLRVLHIGNIGNNAYHNSKLLNNQGVTSHNLVYDYYHIMSSPEWEELELTSQNYGSDFYPEWFKVVPESYSRPKWFAQGPFNTCISYLKALQEENKVKAKSIWHNIQIMNGTSRSGAFRKRYQLFKDSFVRRLWVVFEYRHGTDRIVGKTNDWFNNNFLLQYLVGPLVVGLSALVFFVCRFFYLPFLVVLQRNRSSSFEEEFGELVETMKERYTKLFPDRGVDWSIEEFEYYHERIKLLNSVLPYYDVVMAYSTDPILTMLCEFKPYIAYEHGTIRDIPFEHNITGKLTAVAYSKADVIYMTNADSIEQGKFLSQLGAKLTYGIHGFNEDLILGRLKGAENTELSFLNRESNQKIFFSPARHAHKVKGNHKIILAADQLVKSGITNFKVIFVDWGTDVKQSKNLIKNYGLEKQFQWIDPLDKKQLLLTYKTVDAVLDQFELPCFGGITPEVMILGTTPIISHVDQDIMLEFFGEELPLFNCKEPNEIADSMDKVIKEPDSANKVSGQAKNWMMNHHSSNACLRYLIQSFQRAGL